MSQRDYEKGLPKIAASFGMSKSAVSRSWLKATEKQLEKLRTRSLKGLGIMAGSAGRGQAAERLIIAPGKRWG